MTAIPHSPSPEATHPRLGRGCLSDLALDRLVAGDSSAADQARHLDTCPRCRERLALLEATRAQAAPEIERMLGIAQARVRTVPPAPSLRPRGFSWGRLALAGAALLALALAWPLLRDPVPVVPAGDLPAETIRIKGVSMRFFVQRGDRVAPGVSGDPYRPGDSLRFVVSSDAPRNLLLVGVEASGRVSVYHPFGGDRSAPLEAGTDIALPDSLVLDDSTEDEAFLGLFTDQPLEVDQVRAAIADAMAVSPGLDPALGTLVLPGQHRWIVIRRETP